MIAAQPKFRDATEAVVLIHHGRIKVAVVVNNRLRSSMAMIEFPCGVGLQQEIAIHEGFHYNI